MKKFKRITAILLSLMLVFALSATVFAAVEDKAVSTKYSDKDDKVIIDKDGVYVGDDDDYVYAGEDGVTVKGEAEEYADEGIDEIFSFLKENTALFVVFIISMVLASFTPILIILMIVFIVMNSKTRKELNKYKAAYPYFNSQPFNADAFNQSSYGQNMNGGENK